MVRGGFRASRRVVRREQSTSNDGEEQDSTVKRPRLEDISTLAAEPLQEWLGNLPRDDLRHFALLLYTTLPSKFGLQKTDTATAVADIYKRVSILSDAGLMNLCKMTESSRTRSKVTTLETTL